MTAPTTSAARVPSQRAAAAGVLSGGAALLAGELVGRLLPDGTGPVVAVGNAVVRLAPAGVRDAGIEAFGTADKPLLVAGVLLVCAALAAYAGLLHREKPSRAAALVAVLAALAAAAVAAGPGTAAPLGGVLVGAAVLGVGLVLLRVLLPAPAPQGPSGADRRVFLQRAGAVGLAVVAGGGVLRLLDARGAVERARAALRLRPPVRPAPGVPATAALAVEGLTPLLPPTSAFYRIDTALVVPKVQPEDWSLAVTGMVDRPLRLTLDELLALPQVEADIALSCVSNEVGGDLVGLARWQGVRLRDLLASAGVQPGAEQVVGVSVDGFTAGFPISYATDGRETLVALGMNGELLPVRHGFPARLVVPGLYGYVSATKWLEEVRLTTWEGFDGFWVPRGWSKEGPVKTSSRIDVPVDGTVVAAGPVTVAGMAWAPGLGRGVAAVEVRVDGGPWRAAQLGGALSQDAWRQWRWEWDATPGSHLLEVRATDGLGAVQDERVRPPRPDGATGLHAVRVRVPGV